MREIIGKAETLMEALPYIREFSGKVTVIKYGGHAMTEDRLKESFARDVVLMKYIGLDPVVVHGGGPQINEVMDRMQLVSSFVDGMRVTDRATMDVVEMVLVGKVNKEIVSLINRHGGRAVGISGKDGGLVEAKKLFARKKTAEGVDMIDIGLVGEAEKVNPAVIRALDSSGFIPVIAPVGGDKEGLSYNINADLFAGKIAGALNAEKFVLMTDVAGILDSAGNLIPTIKAGEVDGLVSGGVITGGMIPKVKCALDALKDGVKKVHIIDGRMEHAVLLEIFTRGGVGTEIVE